MYKAFLGYIKRIKRVHVYIDVIFDQNDIEEEQKKCISLWRG